MRPLPGAGLITRPPMLSRPPKFPPAFGGRGTDRTPAFGIGRALLPAPGIGRELLPAFGIGRELLNAGP